MLAEEPEAFEQQVAEVDRVGAGDRLVEASLPFVIKIAKEYRRWGVPMEDLIQQGNLGLLKAAKRFEKTIKRFGKNNPALQTD